LTADGIDDREDAAGRELERLGQLDARRCRAVAAVPLRLRQLRRRQCGYEGRQCRERRQVRS
jgi:hypothetical protein